MPGKYAITNNQTNHHILNHVFSVPPHLQYRIDDVNFPGFTDFLSQVVDRDVSSGPTSASAKKTHEPR